MIALAQSLAALTIVVGLAAYIAIDRYLDAVSADYAACEQAEQNPGVINNKQAVSGSIHERNSTDA